MSAVASRLLRRHGYTRNVPTYEYTCRDCGHTFEIVQSMWDEPLTMCPECGGSLRKVFAPPAISFKGSGFYATDHGRRSKRSEGEGGDKVAATEKAEPGAKKESSSSKSSKDGGKPTSSAPSKKEPAAP
jgi:putative FmdB family regulatory protein